jgi:hypothetical protein
MTRANMLFGVPQYIDIEDKVAGPLTGKQLLWMFGMGAALLVLWNVLEKGAFFAAALPVAGLFCALAFYKPYGQPLIKFLIYSVLFIFRPKVYVWRRESVNRNPSGIKKSDTSSTSSSHVKLKEKAPIEEIESLAKVLDSEGEERNEKILEIINKTHNK